MELSLVHIKIVQEYNLQQYYKKYHNTHYLADYESQLKSLIEYYSIDLLETTKTINRNKQKYYRLKKRIEFLLSKGQCWFCTWTISDDNMNKDHRRKLKEIYKDKAYIINVDYALKTNRKHYHGVILCPDCPTPWSYGFCKFIKIKKDSPFVASYMLKFTAHALKVGTEKENILYSRCKIMKLFNFLEKKEKIKKHIKKDI